MRQIVLILILSIFMGCTDTQLVDYWKNPDIDTYSPSKVLVVGLTANTEARLKFEKQLKSEIEEREIEAVRAADYPFLSVKETQLTETEFDRLEAELIEDGFDTILFTRVVRAEDKIAYKEYHDDFDDTYRRFKEDFLRYQDKYYNPDYYEEYTVYHAETSMYCVCPSRDRQLIWKGYIDITDPKEIDKTISQYVSLVMLALDELNLIEPVEVLEPVTEEELIN